MGQSAKYRKASAPRAAAVSQAQALEAPAAEAVAAAPLFLLEQVEPVEIPGTSSVLAMVLAVGVLAVAEVAREAATIVLATAVQGITAAVPVTTVPEMREAIREMAVLGAPPAPTTEAVLARGAVLAPPRTATARGIRAGMVDPGVAVPRK
jgi:hypothetical protein